MKRRLKIKAEDYCISVADGTHDSPKPSPSGHYLITSRHITSGQLDLKNAYKISKEDFEKVNSRSKVDKWDVLISMIGTVGEPYLVTDEPNFAIKNLGLFKTADKIKGAWLYYYLQSPDGKVTVSELSRGTTQEYIPLNALRNLSILIPEDYNEMKTIVNILSKFDEKIDANRCMNNTLESLAHLIYKSWFIDFNPVRAKADGKQPFGMDQKTAASFPSELEESELGEIPIGWKIKSIVDVAKLNSLTLGKDDPLDKIDYVEISEVDGGEIHNVQTYRRGEEPSRARRRLRHGDTVLSTVRPDRGSYFLCLSPSKSLIASTGFAVITPLQTPWSFIYCALTRPSIFEYLGHQADGGAYPAIRPEVIGNLKVVVPDDQVILDKFHQIIAPMLEMAEANRRQSKLLAKLRDAILPKLLSGELRVPVDEVSNLQAGPDVSPLTE